MQEEVPRRNCPEGTIRADVQAIQQFAAHFGKSPGFISVMERWPVFLGQTKSPRFHGLYRQIAW
jgi:hypothetical protein